MTLSRLIMSGLVGLTVSAASAEASSMIQTFQVGNMGMPVDTTDLNNVMYVSAADGTTTQISLFNPAAVAGPGQIATLTSVIVTMTTSVQTGGTLKNTAANSQNFGFDLNLSSNTSSGSNTGGAAAQSIIDSNFGSNSAGSLTIDFGNVRYSGVASQASVNYPSPNSSSPVTKTTTASMTFTDQASLSAFTGMGGFGENLNTASGQSVSGGGGNVSVNLNTSAGGTFVVEYDFGLSNAPTTTVPEPASMALLGVGMLTVGLVRRRRH